MIILGIESSCDETSASLLEVKDDGEFKILSNIVATQIETHALYGGVVPEIASRAHLEAISSVTSEAYKQAGLVPADTDAVAVTCAPGLIGALLVGVCFAKSLALSLGVPLVPVNHIKAHAAAVYPFNKDLKPPYLAIVVSGSHTSVYKVNSNTDYEEIGMSRDDAAGEAFDKVGRRIGLSYPCGKDMDDLAASYTGKERITFPSPHLKGTYDFSFSGLKTAAVNYIHNTRQKLLLGDGDELPVSEAKLIAASFTDTVTSGIAEAVGCALDEFGDMPIVLAGGVAANSHLRNALSALAEKRNIKFICPPVSLCGDNGAMIAVQGYFEYKAGVRADSYLNAYASEEAAYDEGVFDIRI